MLPLIVIAAASAGCPARADYARFRDLPAESRVAVPAMAERGAPFQVTDTIMGERLPGRRFVSARQIGCRIEIKFEYGGIAHGFGIMTLERCNGVWKMVGQTTKIGS